MVLWLLYVAGIEGCDILMHSPAAALYLEKAVQMFERSTWWGGDCVNDHFVVDLSSIVGSSR
jgi:hypothetical protein